MKLTLENVKEKHFALLMQMAEALNFKVTDIDPTDSEVDAALGRAIESGKSKGRMTKKEQANFESWLSTIK